MTSSRQAVINALYGSRDGEASYSRLGTGGLSDLVPMSEVRDDAIPSRGSSLTGKEEDSYSRDDANAPLLDPSRYEEAVGDRAYRMSEDDGYLEKVLPTLKNRYAILRNRKRALLRLAFLLLVIAGLGYFGRASWRKRDGNRYSPTSSQSTRPQWADALNAGTHLHGGQSFSYGQEALGSQCCNPTFEMLPKTLTPIKSLLSLTREQLDDWISKGLISKKGVDLSRHTRIDGVTMWVNGSDSRHRKAREYFSKHLSALDEVPAPRKKNSRRLSRLGSYNAASNLQNTDNHYRELNELLYNLRSARANLGKYLGTHHVITTDFARDSTIYGSHNISEGHPPTDRQFGERQGQIPQWLDTTSPHVAYGAEERDKMVAIRVHNDWETFVPLVKPENKSLEQWRAERLPTFSSTAAEAVLGVNLPGTSEAFFLSSDDMFVTDKISPADFYTPLYGPVFHLELERVFRAESTIIPGGEHAGHQFSVTLLNKRFGTSRQAYPAHMVKGQLQPLVLETRIIFRKAFEEATKGRFRAEGQQANTHMLGYGTVIERHREALLWSFFMAKIDADGDGTLDAKEFANLLDWLDADGSSSALINVEASHSRNSAKASQVSTALANARFPLPEQTAYSFSSFDGYPYTFPYQPNDFGGVPPQPKRPYRRSNLFSSGKCRINLKRCLPRVLVENDAEHGEARLDTSTENIFKHFAFQNHRCGSCLVQHLVGKSGPKGLESFLPSSKLLFPSTDGANESTKDAETVFHLPLVDDWKLGNFSLKAIASQNNIARIGRENNRATTRREFAVSLLARYNYVIGDAPSEFKLLRSPHLAEASLDSLVSQYSNINTRFAFLCINDDITTSLSEVRDLLQTFFAHLWPSNLFRLPFEKPSLE